MVFVSVVELAKTRDVLYFLKVCIHLQDSEYEWSTITDPHF